MNDGIADSGTHLTNAGERNRSRWWHIPLTIVICVLIIAIQKYVCDQQVSSLNTPEIALSARSQESAQTTCVLVSFVALCGLIALIVGHFQWWKRPFLALISMIALFLSFIISHGATTQIEHTPALLRSFCLVENELNALADAVARDEQPPLPQTLGCFIIVKYERIDAHSVVLYTNVSHDAICYWGFVRCESTKANSGDASVVGMSDKMAHGHHVERLVAHWFVIYDLYTLTKRGWS